MTTPKRHIATVSELQERVETLENIVPKMLTTVNQILDALESEERGSEILGETCKENTHAIQSLNEAMKNVTTILDALKPILEARVGKRPVH